MRPRGLEPPPSCPDQNLNLARLPIPPRAHMVDVNRIFQIYFRKFGRHLVDIDVFERFFEDFKSSGKARKPLILLGFWGIDRPPDPVTRVLEPESSASANSAIPANALFDCAWLFYRILIVLSRGNFIFIFIRRFQRFFEFRLRIRLLRTRCHFPYQEGTTARILSYQPMISFVCSTNF